MPCPVREGQSLYVDKPAAVITHMPPELGGAWEVDAQGGAEASSARAEGAIAQASSGGGGGASGLLTGIMTYSKDRGTSGVRGFLTFTLDRPAVVGSKVAQQRCSALYLAVDRFPMIEGSDVT